MWKVLKPIEIQRKSIFVSMFWVQIFVFPLVLTLFTSNLLLFTVFSLFFMVFPRSVCFDPCYTKDLGSPLGFPVIFLCFLCFACLLAPYVYFMFLGFSWLFLLRGHSVHVFWRHRKYRKTKLKTKKIQKHKK